MKNKPNNNTRVTNLHGISVQQRGSLQNKQPSSKMYTGNAPGTFNHVVVSQPGQRPVGTGTVVATSGVKRDFQTMQGDAQASSAIISRCIPSSKVIEKVQRSPRKKPRKQKHTVALGMFRYNNLYNLVLYLNLIYQILKSKSIILVN